MSRLVSLAIKDVQVLVRDKMALFWTLGFPLLIAIFFGSVFGGGGGSGERGKMTVATVDQDGSECSQRYVELLANNEEIALDAWEEESAAIDAVRRGQRSAVLVIRKGFGDDPLSIIGAGGGDPLIELSVDPARSAEGGLLTGVMMMTGFDLLGERFKDPQYARSMIREQREEIARELDGADLTLQERTTALLAQQFLGTLDGFVESMDSAGWFDSEDESGDDGEGGGGEGCMDRAHR